MLDIARILALRRAGKPVVAADDHADAALLHLRIRPRRGGQAKFDAVAHAGMQRALRRLMHRGVQQTDRRADEHAVLHRLQHVQRFLVRVLAVVDHVHPTPHRALHALRRSAMRVDHAVEIARDHDAGADFVLAHHRAGQCAGARVIVAGDIQLDAVHALAHAKPSQLRHLHRPVGKHREAVAELVGAAFVAQTAGHGDLRPACAHARSRQIARLDRVADHHIDPQLGAGRAVGTGEAMIQQQPGVARGDQRVLLGWGVAEVGRARAVDEGDVGVALDQAGHQGHAARLDHFRAGRLKLAALGCDRADAFAFHQHIGGVGRRARAVPYAAIPEQNAGHRATSLIGSGHASALVGLRLLVGHPLWPRVRFPR